MDSLLINCCKCEYEQIDPESIEYDKDIDRIRDSLGGQTGEITVTLAWNSIDDLDLYLIEPNGESIYFQNKKSLNGGILDIDRNAEGNLLSENPIENIYYHSTPPNGKYKILVNFYRDNSYQRAVPYKVYLKIGSQTKSFQFEHINEGSTHLIYEFNYPL